MKSANVLLQPTEKVLRRIRGRFLEMADSSIRKKVEAIKRSKLIAKKVVNLADFRQLKAAIETRTILAVDDDEIMRAALKRILESEGYRVFVAEDGLELSRVLETTRLDLILLDVNLPWVSGYELCKLIKGHPHLKHVPLFLISAHKTKEDIDRGFEAGCDDYIAKPFDLDKVINAINARFLAQG